MSRFVEEDEDEDLGPIALNINSTDPNQLANAAINAAWQARETAAVSTTTSARWAAVSRAFSAAVDAALQTQDRYAVKEDGASEEYINPHQRIGVLSDDEIETVMALRRGTAKVYPVPEGTDDKPESFEDWARRQIDKLSAIVRDLDAERNGVAKHAGERYADPLGIGTQIHQDVLNAVDGDNHTGRLMWCLVSQLMALTGDTEVVIPQTQWDESGGGQVTVTMRADGGRTIRRS